MRFWLLVLLTGTLSTPAVAPQTADNAQSDPAFFSVVYVEVLPSSRTAALTAIKQYRDASRKGDGFVRLDCFEQVGRPGHFALFEAWRDDQAFNASGPARMAFADSLQPIRVSGFDQRPYKPLSVGKSPTASDNGSIVVVTHVDTAPSPQVADLLKELADASRTDEGNLRFDVVQHTMRANHFTVVEVWRNEKALEAHAAAAHTKRYRNDLQPLTGSPLDERVYRSVRL
jgi:quinol monooxygenase YgiN